MTFVSRSGWVFSIRVYLSCALRQRNSYSRFSFFIENESSSSIILLANFRFCWLYSNSFLKAILVITVFSRQIRLKEQVSLEYVEVRLPIMSLGIRNDFTNSLPSEDI